MVVASIIKNLVFLKEIVLSKVVFESNGCFSQSLIRHFKTLNIVCVISPIAFYEAEVHTFIRVHLIY